MLSATEQVLITSIASVTMLQYVCSLLKPITRASQCKPVNLTHASAAAGYTKQVEEGAIESLLEGATETTTAGQWQGALLLQALTALATPGSELRGRVLSSVQEMLPTMLAASVSNQHNQQMLVGVLHAVRHKLSPFAECEGDVAAAMALDLLTGIVQLTTVWCKC